MYNQVEAELDAAWTYLQPHYGNGGFCPGYQHELQAQTNSKSSDL